jgi:3-methyladenine DNA glycosylase Tag
MIPFEAIYDRAARRKGGPGPLEELLAEGAAAPLAEQTDDRLLSAATQMVFSAGFVWAVIRNKWDGFEEAFRGFEPMAVATMSDADLAALQADTRIVRHGAKIAATRANARLWVDVADEHGSMAEFIAAWPPDDLVGLFDWFKKNGERLGGMTGPYWLRHAGLDTFLFTRSVTAALLADGVVDKGTSSKGDRRKAQAAFNAWAEQSGRSLRDISRTLALSVDA